MIREEENHAPRAGHIRASNANGMPHSDTVDKHILDGIESDSDSSSSSSYDYDHPYNETAADWWTRHCQRRARQICGISSSSSDDSDDSDGSITNVSELSDANECSDRIKNNKERDTRKAARDVVSPLSKWFRSYPSTSARCCLSISSSNKTSVNNSITHYSNLHSSHIRSNMPLSVREQEAKRLRRIFRRLRRKEKEIQFNHCGNNVPSNESVLPTEKTMMGNSSISNLMPNNNHAHKQQIEGDQLAMDSFLPRGTGLSFIDAVLSKTPLSTSKSDKKQSTSTECRLVLELSGPPKSGTSSILIALAARYVASTSSLFLNLANLNSTKSGATNCVYSHQPKRQKQHPFVAAHYSPENSAPEPKVVILDLEHGIHAVKLILSVREAVIRRWEETAAARQWRRKQHQRWKFNADVVVGTNMANCVNDHDGIAKSIRAGNWNYESAINDDNESTATNTMSEQHQIELAIASCLGRIHIVQPRDFTYLSLVATLESLRQSLDNEQIQRSHEHCFKYSTPTMLLIDSLSTLDASTRAQESLPTSCVGNSSSSSSGLSERNEFYRQLIRLREEHEIAIIGTSKNAQNSYGNSNENTSQGEADTRGNRGSGNAWDKMVSHRVMLHHVVEGTKEDREGYDFVATINSNDDSQGDVSIFPYSVTAGGISC